MKNRLLIVAIVILIGTGLVVATGSIYKWKRLPHSLDQYYEKNFISTPPQPPEYLLKMFELGGLMMGVVTNIQQGDMENARNSYIGFSEKYEENSRMVPEWRKYYDLKAVKELGEALDTGDIPGAFEAIGEVGESCLECHKDVKAAVWNRYKWKDFRDVMMKTTNPDEPQLPWPEAKMKYLVVGFDGTLVNINEGQQAAAQQSFELFRAMFYSMKDACSSCHRTERRYYVNQDVIDMVDAAGTEINNGNLSSAGEIMKGIGIVSCYDCHVLHEPSQRAKEEVDLK